MSKPYTFRVLHHEGAYWRYTLQVKSSFFSLTYWKTVKGCDYISTAMDYARNYVTRRHPQSCREFVLTPDGKGGVVFVSDTGDAGLK